MDYFFAYLDALGGVWKTGSGLYGTSDAVPTDTTAVEVAASLIDRRLRVYVGATEIINAELPMGLPTALTGYGLASSPTDTLRAITNFDWVEVYGTGPPSQMMVANQVAADMVMGQLALPTAVTSEETMSRLTTSGAGGAAGSCVRGSYRAIRTPSAS